MAALSHYGEVFYVKLSRVVDRESNQWLGWLDDAGVESSYGRPNRSPASAIWTCAQTCATRSGTSGTVMTGPMSGPTSGRPDGLVPRRPHPREFVLVALLVVGVKGVAGMDGDYKNDWQRLFNRLQIHIRTVKYTFHTMKDKEIDFHPVGPAFNHGKDSEA